VRFVDTSNNPNPMADRRRWLRMLRELDVQTMLDFDRTYTPDFAIASDPTHREPHATVRMALFLT
jgi:hypothetical protein